MPWNNSLLFQIGTLALVFCAIVDAQVGMRPKLPPPRNHPPPSCHGCVRDLNGQVSSNPAPVRKFRSTHPCPANHSLQGPCPGYVVDYSKPLDRGGKDTPENMRWRTIAQIEKARRKILK